jgi:hypothetical protein
MQFRVVSIRMQRSVARLEGSLDGEEGALLEVHLPSLPDVKVGAELELEVRSALPADMSAWKYVAQGEALRGHASTYSFGGLLLRASRLPVADPAFLCVR